MYPLPPPEMGCCQLLQAVAAPPPPPCCQRSCRWLWVVPAHHHQQCGQWLRVFPTRHSLPFSPTANTAAAACRAPTWPTFTTDVTAATCGQSPLTVDAAGTCGWLTSPSPASRGTRHSCSNLPLARMRSTSCTPAKLPHHWMLTRFPYSPRRGDTLRDSADE